MNRARCEAKGDCVEVCPYGVFEVRRIEEEDYRALSLPARLKVFFHGKRSAYTPNAMDCRACGLCVVACPEKAIQIVRASSAA
jgi:NAD-dependent dihydropyrimidine dehydrogenase PreA subunit